MDFSLGSQSNGDWNDIKIGDNSVGGGEVYNNVIDIGVNFDLWLIVRLI